MNRWVIIGLMCLFFWGCASNETVSKKPAAASEVAFEYQLGVGDQIAIQVWKSPELSLNVPVRPDGKVSVPLLGDVQASGQTAESLASEITRGLDRYIRDPQVTVIVMNPVSGEFLRRIRVTGAVAKPISIPHQQGITVLDLVLQAGGLTEFASGNSAKLFRKINGKVEVYPIYLKDILNKGDLETNYVLSPADVVTVPERAI